MEVPPILLSHVGLPSLTATALYIYGSDAVQNNPLFSKSREKVIELLDTVRNEPHEGLVTSTIMLLQNPGLIRGAIFSVFYMAAHGSRLKELVYEKLSDITTIAGNKTTS
jgi:hypothetical protein